MTYTGAQVAQTLFKDDRNLFNQSISADTNILTTDLTPEAYNMKGGAVFTVQASFSVGGIFSAVVTKDGVSKVSTIYNSTALESTAMLQTSIIIPVGYSLNFQFSEDATLDHMFVVCAGGCW